jgi:hypothetical protein
MMKSFEEHADGLVDVLERTIHARVLRELEEPLAVILHGAVREAVTTASKASNRRRPVEGGRCREVWDTLDAVQHVTGEVPSLKEAKDLAKRKNWNEHTTRIQYYRWRKEVSGGVQA